MIAALPSGDVCVGWYIPAAILAFTPRSFSDNIKSNVCVVSELEQQKRCKASLLGGGVWTQEMTQQTSSHLPVHGGEFDM